jgi:hypothetical protein
MYAKSDGEILFSLEKRYGLRLVGMHTISFVEKYERWLARKGGKDDALTRLLAGTRRLQGRENALIGKD